MVRLEKLGDSEYEVHDEQNGDLFMHYDGDGLGARDLFDETLQIIENERIDIIKHDMIYFAQAHGHEICPSCCAALGAGIHYINEGGRNIQHMLNVLQNVRECNSKARAHDIWQIHMSPRDRADLWMRLGLDVVRDGKANVLRKCVAYIESHLHEFKGFEK